MNPPANFSPYLLPSVFNPRYHQHLNHLNDMAFNHTKMLQEIIEKRSMESSASASPHSASSTASISPKAVTSNDAIPQGKRSHAHLDNNNNENEQRSNDSTNKRSKSVDLDEEDDTNLNKRSRKQAKPQQLVKEHQSSDNESANSDAEVEKEEEREMGEIHSQTDKQTPIPIPQAPVLPFPPPAPHNLPFLAYIQDLARTNNITSPISMARFLENLQKELFSAVHTATFESKRLIPPVPPVFPPTMHPHHHPYFSQMFLSNSYLHSYPPPPPPPPLLRFGHPPSDRPFPFHLSAHKKRRTKVTDTRLSPRITTKIIPHDDLLDDEKSLSNHSFDSTASNHHSHQQATADYNPNQMTVLTSLHLRKAKLMFFYTRYPSSSVLKVYFPDVRFNKLITAQLVKWFSNFREFFYIQIEKYARQYLAEGIRKIEDLIITTDSDLYRVLNLHYNRSNQIDVPSSFCEVVQSTLREFFHAIQQQKDLEPSWKKSIYKIIQRLDDQIPEFFKDEHWIHCV